jgi:GGDEF domain-containing protein
MLGERLPPVTDYDAYPLARDAYERARLAGMYAGAVIMNAEAGRQLAIEHYQKEEERQKKEEALRQEEIERHKARHDPLTGLLNREGLEATLGFDLEDVVLLYIDLTNFKAVNDQLGHDRGDEILLEIARLLRSDDIAGRWGGDEFLAFTLPPDSPSGKHDRRRSDGLTPAQRAVATKARFEKDMTELLERHSDARDLGLRAAVGTAVGGWGMQIEQLRGEAEANMFTAKDIQHKEVGQYRSATVPHQRTSLDPVSSLEDTSLPPTI